MNNTITVKVRDNLKALADICIFVLCLDEFIGAEYCSGRNEATRLGNIKADEVIKHISHCGNYSIDKVDEYICEDCINSTDEDDNLKREISGWKYKANIVIKTDNLEDRERIYRLILNIGGNNNWYYYMFSEELLVKLRNEMNERMIKNARKEAESIAEAISARICGIKHISKSEEETKIDNRMKGTAIMKDCHAISTYKGANSAEAYDIFKGSMYVTFEIADKEQDNV